MGATLQNQTPVKTERGKPTTVPYVVIIGAGFGGLQATKALRKLPVAVTVIDSNNSHLFQPMLYQVATAGLSPADIASPIRYILRKQRNAEILMAEVTGIDTQKQLVLMHDQSVHYDYLIVATGAANNYFHHPDWRRYAPGLKSMEDAVEIRRNVLSAFEMAERETDEEKRRSLLTFVLVGGGPTGVELAGALAELANRTLAGNFRRISPTSARIILVEGKPRIMPSFPASLTGKARRKLQHLGVEVRTGVHVDEVDENGVRIGDQRVETKNVIWTAGVKASPAGQWLHADVDHDGRVKVQSDLTVPGHPNIFVIGDTALLMQDGKPLPGLAPVAMQEGDYVASVLADRIAGREHRQQFHYHDKGTMAVIGRSFGVVDIGPLRFTGTLAWFFWLFIHIMFLIGTRNRLIVLIQYAWAYFTYQRGARIILDSRCAPTT
jgi:NADH dehydrogenase